MTRTRTNIDQLEATFKALADRTRLRILALLGGNEVCVCHLHDSLALSQPTVSRHLAYLRRAGLVSARRDGVWMHYRVSDALAPEVRRVLDAAVEVLARSTTTSRDRAQFTRTFGPLYVLPTATGGTCCAPRTHHTMTTVLFACVHNAGRSQMAAAWFNALADPARARAISAGTDPGPRVHPEVASAMAEAGLDLLTSPTTKLTTELAAEASLLITMGCGDACPVVPGVERDDWPLEDPKGQPLPRVRGIRDEIRRRVQALVDARGWARS